MVIFSSLIVKRQFPKEKELSRKIVHIGSGLIVPLALWVNISTIIAIPIAITITLALLINYKLKIIDLFEDVERKSYGTIYYALSITVLIILFWSRNPAAATTGVLIMAFGDGLAGLIGRKIESPNWIIFGQRKSLIGTLTMFIISALVIGSVSSMTGTNLNLKDIFAITSLAVLFEQISPWGIDNITVPIGIALIWQWITLQ